MQIFYQLTVKIEYFAAYLLLMSCDPNPDVRRAVLQSIAASTRTVPAILERTRDVKETTRKLAFQVLSEKVHIKALTIAQRVKLLQDGLNDRTGTETVHFNHPL